MPAATLARKMKIKPGQRLAIIHAPDGYLDELGPLPADTELSHELTGTFDWVQIFVRSKAELDALVPQLAGALKPSSLLWITFPKGSSKMQTNLTRDVGWEALQQADLKWITLISVNPTWSAFSLRPYKPGEQRQSFR
jgi:hypothetical protein